MILADNHCLCLILPFALINKLVWAMKRLNGNPFATTVTGAAGLLISPNAETMARSNYELGHESVPLILKEIRDELKEQTNLLRTNFGSRLSADNSE